MPFYMAEEKRYLSLAISLHIIYKEGTNVLSVEKKENDWKEKDI